jgi:nitrous oxidase accessory protein NosD
MQRMLIAAAVALLSATLPDVASGQTITFAVDCSRGQTIADAITRADARKPLVLLIRGTCNEYVNIIRDDVTLRGDPGSGGAINGPGSTAAAVTVQGDRTALESLTVTGGATGVLVSGPYTVTLANVVVQNPASGNAVLVRGSGYLGIAGSRLMHAPTGLAITRGSSARVYGGSEIRDNSGAGIYVHNNGSLVLSGNSKVLANGGPGVSLETGSAAEISNTEISGNQSGIVVTSTATAAIGGNNVIHDNREHGILAQAGAMVGVDNNEITGNGEIGVFGYLGATLVLHGNTIADNGTGVACRSNCTLQIGGATITANRNHGIVVQLDSTLILEAPTTDASGNSWVDLWCGDKESSVDGWENFVGERENCTDFNN